MTVSLKASARAGTLSRLRAASRHLFVEKGYHETRPQDIAREAGVANGTFYMHFADKQQAFLDFAEQAQEEWLAFLRLRLDQVDQSKARWQAICDSVVDFSHDHPGLLQAAFIDPVFIAPNDENAWRIYDRLGQLVSKALEEELGDGIPAHGYNLEMISHGLCGFLRQAMIYAGRKDIDRDKMANDIGEFINRGLGIGTEAATEAGHTITDSASHRAHHAAPGGKRES